MEEKKAKKKKIQTPSREILLPLNDTELMAIVEVEDTCSHPDSPFGVTIFCKAMDSFGMVFDLEMKFSCESTEVKERILTDLMVDSIHLVKGQYNVFKKGPIIHLIDPEYMVLPPDILEEDVREVFMINSKSLDNSKKH